MKKHKILIVEDYKHFQRVLRLRLKNNGFDIITAEDGCEGYEITKRERPDLIILDIVIPTVDGFHVSRLLKSDTHLKNIPIILISGIKRDAADKGKGIDSCRADAYLFKPFGHQELLDTINRLIAKK